MTSVEIKQVIKEVSGKEGVDPDLLLAICTVESSLDPYAVRYGPAYKWLVSPREWASQMRLSVVTEGVLQKTSYGLAQIMGAVMRELGFSGKLQTCLVDPAIPLSYSAKHLKNYLRRYGSEVEAIASYNAGSPRKTKGGMWENQTYVDKVSAELRKLRTLV
jgi:soluble lytic murein transglycosylase-like protein